MCNHTGQLEGDEWVIYSEEEMGLLWLWFSFNSNCIVTEVKAVQMWCDELFPADRRWGGALGQHIETSRAVEQGPTVQKAPNNPKYPNPSMTELINL